MPDIIIVEDNKEIGTLLCDFLRRENYTVSLADTGEKALSIFEQYGAKLLVLDIGFPDLMVFRSARGYERPLTHTYLSQVPKPIRKARLKACRLERTITSANRLMWIY